MAIMDISQRTVKIIDQYSGGNFNALEVAMEGYTGVIFKAGQGAWADVPRYKPEWWKQAKDAGLMRGWYWLVDSRIQSPDHIKEMERINLFDDLGELGLWLDVEKPVIKWTEKEYFATQYHGIYNVMDVAYLLEVRNIKFGIYTGEGAYELVSRGATKAQHDYLAKFPLWTAQYHIPFSPDASRVRLYGSWDKWTLWQWRESPDINIFNGEDEEFYALFNQVKPELTTEEPMPSKYFGEVKVTLNVRPAPSQNPVLFKLLLKDKVEASAIADGWWKLSKVVRGSNVLALPAQDCFAYQGENNGYISLDKTEDSPVIVDPPAGITKTHTIEVFSDGSITVDGVKY